MTRVEFIDQNGTHFATFDLPELPRKDDIVEIGFPNEQIVKTFTVKKVVHRMVQLPDNDPPWHWEFRLHGHLHDPKARAKEPACICAQGITNCPRHGWQPAKREVCPVCKTHVLGYCAQGFSPNGVYCTDDACTYVA